MSVIEYILDYDMINDDLERFAKHVPVHGFHLSYLYNVCELMELYGEALSVMENERTVQNKSRVEEIAQKIRKIVVEALANNQENLTPFAEACRLSGYKKLHLEWPRNLYLRNYVEVNEVRGKNTLHSGWPSELYFRHDKRLDSENVRLTGRGIHEIDKSLKDIVKNIWMKENPATEELFKIEFIKNCGDPAEEGMEDEYAEYVRKKSELLDENFDVNPGNFKDFIYSTDSFIDYFVWNYIKDYIDDCEKIEYSDCSEEITIYIHHYCFRDKDANLYEIYEYDEDKICPNDIFYMYSTTESWFIMNDKFLVEPGDWELLSMLDW